MPWYTGLDRVAKSTGRPVELVDGWKSHGHGPMNSVKSIICHHTAGPDNGKNYPSYGTVRNGRPGLPGPLAQLGIGRDGTIYVFGAGVAYHAGKVTSTKYNNWNALGIEAENNGTGEKWGDELMESYVLLVRALIDEFKLPLSAVLGHKEVCKPRGRKIDPNFDMDAFRAAVKRGYWKKGGGKPSPAPAKPVESKPAPAKAKPAGKEWPDVPMKVNGSKTKEWDRAWRELLAAVGYKDKDLTKNFQNWLKDHGEYKGLVDSSFGSMTVKALQSFLKDKGLYKGLIDGKRQKMTIEAEKAYLSLPANRGVK